ncbi:ubiquitin family protein [Perilla frutescens var. frutescens]|nr:ubiquitin family protein [Perilla frutescens var. frutescens]
MGGGDIADDGVDSSNGIGEESKLNIRCSNGSKFSVQVNLNSTVEDFKLVVAQKCEIPAQQQRLIYKGRIMKDDQTLKSFGLEDNHIVHLVRGFATAAPLNSTTITDAGIQNTNSTSTNAGSNGGRPRGRPEFGPVFFPEFAPSGNGLGNASGLFGALPGMEQMQEELDQDPDMIRDILNMPGVQNLMNNPETIRNLIMNNPQMREIMDRNPDLGHILNDPATLRQTMDAAQNPEIMREMMRNTDRAMSNIESSPEGFNMLRRLYENVQEPLLNATTLTEDNRSDLGSNPLAARLRAQAGRTGTENMANSPAPNTNPLPNPWASAGTGGSQTNSGAWVNPTDNDMADSPGGLGFPDLDPMLGSMPDPTAFNQLMQNPVISQMMRNTLSNPQYMNQILGFNPQLQNILESNPQLRDMMQNSEFIHQLTSPETMQQLLNFHRALAPQIGIQTSREPAQNDGGTASAAGNMGLNMLMNLFGGLATGGGINSASRPQVPPEERYATQLSQLQEMGFFDTQENIRALMATAGNVHAAVERLLGNPGQ